MQKALNKRKYVISMIFIIAGVIFVLRLFWLQIVDRSYYFSANNNVLRHITQYPARGLIYDRGGELLVYNEATYDLMVIPRQARNFDTLELCGLIGIDYETFRERMKKIREYSLYRPSVFEKQISKEAYGFLEEKLYKFPGFYVQPRTLRKYVRPIAAHTMGYVGEVSPRICEVNPYYKPGDYIGISGIEKSYEEALRGIKGSRIIMVDVFNRDQGSFQDGKYDTIAVMGKNLYASLDMKLQEYGELLMTNKRGSVVAIEPESGEILALVTSPGYDPNLLVGRVRSYNYNILAKDSLKPLFNRALQAQYPPGSTFKLVHALIGLEEGVLNLQTRYGCAMGYSSGPIHVGCHAHAGPLDLIQSIAQSCNAYYCNVFRTILDNRSLPNQAAGYAKWREMTCSLGFGSAFDSDIPNLVSGFIPKNEYFDNIYGKNRWRFLTIVSLSIGQGEILTTPLQLANLAATIANRGYYCTPHIIRAVGKQDDRQEKFQQKHSIPISRRHFETVVEGMYQVVEAGTAHYYKMDSIPICGKTGTAQNPHGKDHSIFIAFAPKDNPKIAISVIVENAGFGATWAAPIAFLMIEKYLMKEIKRKDVETRMIEGNLLSN
ncbi:MAG TPA: penicillin-binding protein 2 [Bacteroidales bacterium]|nr:penicillin-binding protein 2 [Bacteroidales bacterium]HSA44630.1 penicillin-binding protein 2 [Bacteroidales bacterium]